MADMEYERILRLTYREFRALWRKHPRHWLVDEHLNLLFRFVSRVFDGGFRNAGLTNLCDQVARQVLGVARAKAHQSLRQWRFHLGMLREFLLERGVPRLEPLCFVEQRVRELFAERSRAPVVRQLIKDTLITLDGWRADAQLTSSVVLAGLDEGEHVLIVGHSHIIEKAIRAGIASGKYRLYHYCPGPLHPKGRSAQCPGCVLGRMGATQVGRAEALRLVGKQRVGMVLVSSCAYSFCRRIVWACKGAAEIAKAANDRLVMFRPVGGRYKRFESPGDLEKHTASTASPYVDKIDRNRRRHWFSDAFLG